MNLSYNYKSLSAHVQSLVLISSIVYCDISPRSSPSDLSSSFQFASTVPSLNSHSLARSLAVEYLYPPTISTNPYSIFLTSFDWFLIFTEYYLTGAYSIKYLKF